MGQIKNKNIHQKKSILIIICFFVISTALVALNTQADPDYPDETDVSCHSQGEEYTIFVDEEYLDFEAETSSNITLEVNGTGENVVIDVYPEALDNELFIILPSVEIADNSEYDLDNATDSIRVVLTITVPSEIGIYKLRILSRSPTLDGVSTALAVVDIQITVGEVIKGPLELFFDHNNIYLGGISLIITFIGVIIFQINVKRKQESKIHGIFIATGLVLTSINIFLILDIAMDFTFNPIDLTIPLNLGQLNHIILGLIGYIAGIIVVFGTFTNAQGIKLTKFVYTMLITWILNFFYGIFIMTTNFGLGG